MRNPFIFDFSTMSMGVQRLVFLIAEVALFVVIVGN